MTREKKIYLLLTDTGTMLNRMIKTYTKKPYNHASIALDADLMEVYSFGRKTANNPFLGGFVREDMHSLLFRQADCAIYSLTIPDEEFQKMVRFIRAFDSRKEEYRYNFIGLFGVVLKKPIHRKNAYFCSQFVAAVLKQSTIVDLKENDLPLVKPYELAYCANFQLVYEGRLRDYQSRQGTAGTVAFVV